MIYKKTGITYLKYVLYSAEEFFGKHTNHKNIKDGLGGPMGIRAKAMKEYNKYGSKCKKELKNQESQQDAL